LANVLARQQAMEAGAFEAWLVDGDGLVTEGTASNAWIVTADGLLLTRDASHAILNGITRQAVLRIAAEHGVALREGPFSVAEALSAAEAFLTSTTSLIKPVVRIDGAVIGDGRIGRLTSHLLDYYVGYVGEGAGGFAGLSR
jgi:D-alanine transaminase